MSDYRVRPNDTLSTIASRSQVTLGALERANPQIHNPNVIRVGQRLHIPDGMDPGQGPGQAQVRAPARDLAYGQRNASVKRLQTGLVQLGYLKQSDMNTGPGIFGPHTRAALSRFQERHGIHGDGGNHYGPKTRAALQTALGQPAHPSPAPAPSPSPTPNPSPSGSGYVKVPPGIRQPRWTPQQAVRYALDQVKHPDENYYEKCDHFAAACYGYGGSGYTSAASHWASIPSSMRHPGNTNPPAGALVFWTGGSHGYGHVAISLGNGKIASTDIRRHGQVDVVPLSEIHQRWGLSYAGWAPPYLNASWGVNPHSP